MPRLTNKQLEEWRKEIKDFIQIVNEPEYSLDQLKRDDLEENERSFYERIVKQSRGD
jgi:flagellin-specific chaperone FliS